MSDLCHGINIASATNKIRATVGSIGHNLFMKSHTQLVKHTCTLTPTLLSMCRTSAHVDKEAVSVTHGNCGSNSFLSTPEDFQSFFNQGRVIAALRTLHLVDNSAIRLDSYTYISLLQACVDIKSLSHSKLVHAHIILTGFEPDGYLETKLITVYTKCSDLANARRVLNEMIEPNVVSWTALIAAYTKSGNREEALALFGKMQRTGIEPDQFTFATVLPICGNLSALKQGKEIHERIIRNGFQSDVFVESSLLDMYAKCGRVMDSRKVFDAMLERDVVAWNAMIAAYARNGQVGEALKIFEKTPERDLVSWNAMIAAYVQNCQFVEALKLFRLMQLTGMKPDAETLTSVILSCANLKDICNGKEAHENVIRNGFGFDVFVGSALVDMYSKCKSIEDALKVFDEMPKRDVVSWNAMIVGYAQNGHLDESLNLFRKMPERNLVSWNAMIAGYTQNEQFVEAIRIFREMQLTGVKPNSDTLASVLTASANLLALRNGKSVHRSLIRKGFESNVFVESALVDMYAKCGSIEYARNVFDKMRCRDVVSWTVMIVGYAMHGYGRKALQLFNQMLHENTKPDGITFVGVLAACCHAGLVDDGWQFFHSMSRDYNIAPSVEHYCCMVDLLGRAGRLDEAHNFVNKMAISPDASVWGSLLGACRAHNNIELGQYAAERLLESDLKNAAHYVLLSNIYAAAGRWDEATKVRKLMKNRGVRKIPGSSWIEINNEVHAFVVGDKSHPQMHKIYAELEILFGHMKEEGYVSDTHFVLHDVEEEQKNHIICYHSEKLAIVFGLINTPPTTTIQIVKNLRVCGDCHSATKFISKLVSREIVVRDANRFHHFKDGQCSCGDYW